MGAGEFLGASAILNVASGFETNRVNKKLAQQQEKATQEAQSEANKAQKEALLERRKKIDAQREQLSAVLGNGFKTATGASLVGTIQSNSNSNILG